jgi:flagellar biosynthetic protein FliQ
MNDTMVIDLVRGAITVTVVVAAPVLIVSMVVGLVVSILQTTTSIQEQTLSFVPKILAVLAALVYFGYFMISHMVDYTMGLFSTIPNMVR